MRLAEFVEAVESYGVTCPTTNKGALPGTFRRRLGIDDGRYGKYAARDVRRVVAWQLTAATSGAAVGDANEHRQSRQAPQRHQAMRLLAAAPEGWVVMADGRAWWSLVPPVRTLRSRCAVAIPVPDWKH